MDFCSYFSGFVSMKPQFFNNCISVNKKLQERKTGRKEKMICFQFFLEVFLYNHKGFWYNDIC